MACFLCFKEHDCLLTQEPLEHVYLLPEWRGRVKPPLISNAILACKPRHPFYETVIRQLPLHTGDQYVVSFSWSLLKE